MAYFSINNKKFKGKYYDQIISGIHKKYKKIYPDSEIEVVYKMSGGEYTFFVYITLDIIETTAIKEKVLIKSYNNYGAITYFSSILLEDYMKEYDDSKKNYLEKFIEETNALIMSYKLAGMNIKPINYKNNYYTIIIHHKSSWVCDDCIRAYFKFKNMITEEEYKNHLRDVKSRLKQKYEKWVDKQ